MALWAIRREFPTQWTLSPRLFPDCAYKSCFQTCSVSANRILLWIVFIYTYTHRFCRVNYGVPCCKILLNNFFSVCSWIRFVYFRNCCYKYDSVIGMWLYNFFLRNIFWFTWLVFLSGWENRILDTWLIYCLGAVFWSVLSVSWGLYLEHIQLLEISVLNAGPLGFGLSNST